MIGMRKSRHRKGGVARQVSAPQTRIHLTWILPWLRVLSTLAGPMARAGDRAGSVGLFYSGYLSVWLAFSLVAASLQLVLGATGLLSADDRLGPRLSGLFLLGAGLYQATPLKSSCLRHCRNPLTFFLARWRDGPVGALRMGIGHGVFCLGCCWALMALALVLGVMNLAWMAALAFVVGVENLAPKGAVVGRVLGLALALWGAVVWATA